MGGFQRCDRRRFTIARRSPRGPEPHEDIVPGRRRQIERLAVELRSPQQQDLGACLDRRSARDRRRLRGGRRRARGIWGIVGGGGRPSSAARGGRGGCLGRGRACISRCIAGSAAAGQQQTADQHSAQRSSAQPRGGTSSIGRHEVEPTVGCVAGWARYIRIREHPSAHRDCLCHGCRDSAGLCSSGADGAVVLRDFASSVTACARCEAQGGVTLDAR